MDDDANVPVSLNSSGDKNIYLNSYEKEIVVLKSHKKMQPYDHQKIGNRNQHQQDILQGLVQSNASSLDELSATKMQEELSIKPMMVSTSDDF